MKNWIACKKKRVYLSTPWLQGYISKHCMLSSFLSAFCWCSLPWCSVKVWSLSHLKGRILLYCINVVASMSLHCNRIGVLCGKLAVKFIRIYRVTKGIYAIWIRALSGYFLAFCYELCKGTCSNVWVMYLSVKKKSAKSD